MNTVSHEQIDFSHKSFLLREETFVQKSGTKHNRSLICKTMFFSFIKKNETTLSYQEFFLA
jgi:hypothetical protein